VLAANGVSVAPAGPARPGRVGGTVAFPITGGQVEDLSTGAGTVRHSGGLVLRAGRVSVRLTDFTVTVGRRAPFTARVGDARVPVSTSTPPGPGSASVTAGSSRWAAWGPPSPRRRRAR